MNTQNATCASGMQVFTNPAFGEVRTLTENGKTLFCAMDIARPLGYKRERDAIQRHCKGAVKRGALTGGGIQEMTFIPEGDVYRLIARSNLPEAQKFESWIFDEVVPSIRKNGGYIAGQESLTDTELLAKAVLVAQKTIEERNTRIRALTEKIELDAPKVLFADSVSASKDSILIGELAKILTDNGVPNMGQNRLFQWMRDNGYLVRRAGTDYNVPTQSAMERGLFTLKETAITHSDGHISTRITTRVSGKGQQYFVNLFLKAHNLLSADEREAEKAYKDALEYFCQTAPGMAICEREHAGKKYLCVPMESARRILTEKAIEPRRFFERVREAGLTRKRAKGFSFPVRVGENVTSCLWFAVTPEPAAT